MSSSARMFRRTDQRWTDELHTVFALAWPIVLGNLTHMAIFATDTAFIGHYDPRGLAAAALATNLMHMMMAVGFGLSMASAPMMANAIGRGLHAVRDVRRTVRQAIWVCWTYSLLAMVVLWQGERIFLLLGQEPDLAAAAGSYLRILQWMMFPLLGFWVLRFFVLTLGRPRLTLAVTVAGIVVNALGNYLLVFGHLGFPELGLAGSGIASLLASIFLFAAMARVCSTDRRLRRFAVLGRFWRSDWPRFAAIWQLGLPIGVTSAMEGLLFSGSVFIVGRFGAETLAAHAIVMQLCAFAFMIPLGVSEAATMRVGFWAGRCDAAGVTAAGNAALALAVGCALVSATTILAFPGAFLSPFLDMDAPRSSEIFATASHFLVFAAVFQIADGLQMVGAGALRGLKDARMHMAFILTGHMVLALPTGAALAFWGGLGGIGVWIGFTLGLTCVAAMVLRRWIARRRLNLLERCAAMTEATL